MASRTARTRRRSPRRTRHTTSLAGWIGRISPAGWIALGACGVALVLALQTLQGQGGGEYDEGVYWQSLRAMANGHPLFSEVFSSQPPLFLLSIYPFYMLFGQSLEAARLALLCFSLVGIAGAYVAGRALGHRLIGAVAALLLALDPLYEHGAHTLQAELPSVALQLCAVACAVQAMRASGRRRDWLAVGAGALLGAALMVKLFAVAALLPVVLYLTLPLAQRWLAPDGKLRQPAWPEIQDGLRQIAPGLGLMFAGMFGVIVLVLLPFVGQLGAVYDQVVRFHLAAARADTHSLRYNVQFIAQTLVAAPLIYAGALATVVMVWRRMWVSLPLLLWTLASFVVLVRQQPLFAHHVVLLSPSLALIAGCGACAVSSVLAMSDKRLAQVAVALALVLVAGAGLILNWKQNAAANAPIPVRTLKMALALQGVSAPQEIVLTDDQYLAALANRDVPPTFVDTSAVRITSGYLTTTQLEDYITHNRVHVILFASGRFDLLHGFRAWVAARYSRVATFEHGGALYVLEPSSNPPV